MKNLPKAVAVPMRRQSGFTLVEMMVGVLIGLIATVIMFQIFAVSEGQKRTTTGAGDAQQSGLISLFQMERDIRMAGNGLNLPTLLGCVTNGFNTVGGGAFTLPLVPVNIVNGAGTASDTVTVIYGSSDTMASPERLRNAITTSAQSYILNNRYGFKPGDVLVVGELGKSCVISQVSALPGSAEVAHLPGSYVDSQGAPQPLKFNGGAVTFPGYGAWVQATNGGGRIFNLGDQPTFVRYAVVGSELHAIDVTAPTNFAVVADGIVQMQAQYGYDGNGDGKLTAPSTVGTLNPAGADQWADAVPVGMTAENWSRITAVRLAVVSRSVTPEKPNASGICDISTNGPRWYARDPVTPYYIDVSASGANWGCYRYRVFEVTIPIRNIGWFPDETL